MAEFETRTVHAAVEVRDDGDTPTLTGYAATFDEPYPVTFFRERLHPEAFKRTLSMTPDVRLLIDHQGQPLARTKSGTLQLSADSKGLEVRAQLDPSDPDVQRLLPKMRRGDLDQMSFGFRVPSGGDAWDYSGEMPLRTIREANLSGGDVSVVTYPANEGTSAQVRSRETRDAAYTLVTAFLAELREGRSVDHEKFHEAFAVLHPDVAASDLAAKKLTPDDVRAVVPDAETGSLPVDLARRLAEAAALRSA